MIDNSQNETISYIIIHLIKSGYKTFGYKTIKILNKTNIDDKKNFVINIKNKIEF